MSRHGTAFGVVRALHDAGVERVFFVTGGDQPFWIALKEEGMGLALARSEAAAVAMADGYSRATGRPSVVYGQWGPGAANVAAALADAYWAHSPVVALTSSVPASQEGRFAYQELDQVPLFASVTKWNRRVPDPARAAEMASLAVQAAVSGCPGPVHLDIPKDWLAAELDSGSPIKSARASVPAPNRDAMTTLTGLLGKAERPLILAGNGVLLSGAAEMLTAAAERWQLPVASSMGGKGSISEEHPLAIGVVGRYSRKSANEIVRQADLVVAVGTDLGGMVTDGYKLPSPDATVVQVDIDPSRLGVGRSGVVPIVADAGELFARLSDESSDAAAPRSDWVASTQAATAAWKADFERIARESPEGFVGHEAAIRILREIAHDEDVLVADTGFIGAWGGALWSVPVPGRYFIRAAGTLGWSFPAALGAQLAMPVRRAICLSGDGGIGYNLGELETALRLDIPVVAVVLNNNALAYEYLVQKHLYDTIVPEVNDFAEVDYAAVARAVGVKGHRAESEDELRDALTDAFAERKPALVEVRVSAERFAPTTSFDGAVERDL
jgi:acetolactate synthase-1/2/3 large subunit